MFGIFDLACELLPPLAKELYLCTVAPLLYLLFDLLPPLKQNVQYIQTVCGWRGGGGVDQLYCRPYSAGVLHSLSDQIRNLQNCFTTPNKMTSKDDINGLVSLKFLRPWVYVVDVVWLYHSPALLGAGQGVTRRCRLSWFTNSALVYGVKMEGISQRVLYSCAHHETWRLK